MNIEELDFDKICRVCCSEGQMVSIFKVHIHKKLMACASVQVWQDDGLPRQICSECIAKLHIALQFKKLCERSDARLRYYLNSTNSGKVNTEGITQEGIHSQSMPIQAENEEESDPAEEEQQEQHEQPQDDSPLVPLGNANEYIYVECSENISDVNDIKPFDTLPALNQMYPAPLQPYHLQTMPSVQFQAFNVHPEANQLITLTGQCPSSTNGSIFQSMHSNDNMIMPPLSQEELKIEKNHNTNENKKLSNYVKRTFASTSLRNDITCDTCGKKFISLNKLNRHMKTHSNDLPYRCTMCHKGFTHSGNYKVHLRMHTNERPFQCTICDHACRQQQDLEKHMRTHTGERPHVCQVCNRAFSTSSNLIAHSRIHSGEKPYVCSICQKSFCQSNELTKHTRTHTGEKSHTCKFCNKGFNGSSTLVVHMRTHSGERPYVCNICDKRFTQSNCLHVHLKRHNTVWKINTDFVCLYCDRTFRRALELHKHIKTTHATDVSDC